MRVEVSSRISLLSAAGVVAAAVVFISVAAFQNAEGQKTLGRGVFRRRDILRRFRPGRTRTTAARPPLGLQALPGRCRSHRKRQEASSSRRETRSFSRAAWTTAARSPWPGRARKESPSSTTATPTGSSARARRSSREANRSPGGRRSLLPSEVEQNPHWQNLYYTYLDGSRTFFNFSLFEGDNYLAAAQDPKLDDPFFFDRVGSVPDSPRRPTESR